LFRANAEDTGKKRIIPLAEGWRWYYETARGKGEGRGEGACIISRRTALNMRRAANGFGRFSFSFLPPPPFSLSLLAGEDKRGQIWGRSEIERMFGR